MNNFSVRLREYRKQLTNLNAKDFAKMANITYSTYSSYEQGVRYPTYENLRKLSKVLNITIEELTGVTQNDKYKNYLEKIGYNIIKTNNTAELIDIKSNKKLFCSESEHDLLNIFKEIAMPIEKKAENDIINLFKNTIYIMTTYKDIRQTILNVNYDEKLNLHETLENIIINCRDIGNELLFAFIVNDLWNISHIHYNDIDIQMCMTKKHQYLKIISEKYINDVPKYNVYEAIKKEIKNKEGD